MNQSSEGVRHRNREQAGKQETRGSSSMALRKEGQSQEGQA